MKLLFRDAETTQDFVKWYHDKWTAHGFTWDLFPDLTVKINIPTSNPDPLWGRDHYDMWEKEIVVRILDTKELEGSMEAWQIEMVMAQAGSSLFHEIMHHIHFQFFGSAKGVEDMEKWNKAFDLMGRRRPTAEDFKRKNVPGSPNHSQVHAYEVLAVYFDNVINGVIDNKEFIDYIKNIIGMKKNKAELETIIDEDIDEDIIIPQEESTGFKEDVLNDITITIKENYIIKNDIKYVPVDALSTKLQSIIEHIENLEGELQGTSES